MDNSTNPSLADAHRRSQALQEEESRQAEQQRGEQQRVDDQRTQERQRTDGPDRGTSAQLDQQAQERADLQDDNRKADNLQDSHRRDDDHRADDRRKDEDRREDERKAERRPEAEDLNNSEFTEQIDVSKVGKIEQSADNSLIAQVNRHEAEQNAGKGADSSESSATFSRSSDRGGKAILDPNDLANQEHQQQTPRPGGERVNSAQITEVESKAERVHVAQGVRNQTASKDAMSHSLAQGGQGGQGAGVLERTRARNNQTTESNVAAGKTEVPDSTREFAVNSQQRLEVEVAKAQEKETVKKPELAQ